MKYFHYLFFFFVFHFTFAQNKPIDSIVSGLQKDQLLFEKVFIHTNKTNYVNEDVIWFKAYVLTNENKPSLNTTLLYVSLFSESSQLIETKTVYVKEGVGNNQFEFNEDLVSGNYYIQAHTNNMLNFGKDDKFITRITIGEDIKFKTTSKALYDIQFFPEGGQFLEGVKNVIGIKALVNGKGYDYKGRIVNSKNEKVASFSSIHLGMSKSQFEYKENEKYKAIIAISDTIIEKELPTARKEGVVISKMSSNKDVVEFKVSTNDKSNLDEYVLLFHQNNKIIDYVEFDFYFDRNEVFTFQKEDFLKGVNSVTVLKNNEPILERKFFVNGKVNNEFSIETLNKVEDSIIYKLKVKDLTTKSNISISVLSSNVNYSSNTDIASAMYLTPYVKGYVEQPSYYFNQEHVNREAYLDLLLLTQGWTQYSQEEFIENINPKQTYDFEKGIVVKGELSPVLTNNLGVFTTYNKLITKQFLNNQTTFAFNNLIAYKGDSIKLAFIDREVLRRQPKKIKYDSIPTKDHKLAHFFYDEYVKELQKNEKESITEVVSYKKQDGVIGLENVKLETGKKDKTFVTKHKKEVFEIGAYNRLEIPKKYFEEELTMREFLFKDRGYFMLNEYTSYPFLISNWTTTPSGKRVPVVVVISVDGVYIKPFGPGMPLETLFLLPIKDVEDIALLPKKTKYHHRLAIFTTEDYKKGTSNNFSTYVFKEGFSRSKKYYAPLFSQETNTTNKEIDWKPNLISTTNGDVVFKIKDNLVYENVLFSIQGFSNKGELISGFYTLDNSKAK